jgi:hypothetical protein
VHPIVPLLQLLHVVGRIEGRKRLQKMVHILQELGIEFQERFQYSFYGMYSLQLKSEIEVLKEEGLVSEIALSNASFAVTQTEELERLLQDFELMAEPDWANLARHLNSFSPVMLEGISTIYYLRHTETDESAVRGRLLALKPHLGSCIDKCFDEADTLRSSRRETATA